MQQFLINVFNIKENIRKAQKKLNQSLNTLVQNAFSGALIKQNLQTTITVQLEIAWDKTFHSETVQITSGE